MRSAITRLTAILATLASMLPVVAAPPSALCALVSASFADVLAGPVKAMPLGVRTCMVSVGSFADMSIGIDVSIHPGDSATLKSMRGLLHTRWTDEPSLSDGAYSILDTGGGGMLPQLTINASRSGKWAIIEVRRRSGFGPADLAKLRSDAKRLLAGL
jgi:hypothetical protein